MNMMEGALFTSFVAVDNKPVCCQRFDSLKFFFCSVRKRFPKRQNSFANCPDESTANGSVDDAISDGFINTCITTIDECIL